VFAHVLQYLEKIPLMLGTNLKVVELIDYDHSVMLEIDMKMDMAAGWQRI